VPYISFSGGEASAVRAAGGDAGTVAGGRGFASTGLCAVAALGMRLESSSALLRNNAGV